MEEKEKWHIPFRGRGHSGCFICNFLWQKGSVYVMDNHRLAMWCWLQKIKNEEKIDLLHIDQHYDCIASRHEQWLSSAPDKIEELTLTEYVEFPWEGNYEICPLFRSDNYLSIFLEKYKERISSFYVATHKDGDLPKFVYKEFNLFESLGYLNARCSGINAIKCIINIDLDYFTKTGFGDPFVVVSNEYIDTLCGILKTGLESKSILCLTFALSPEFVGSWEMSEKLFNKISEELGLGFMLPDETN